MNINITYDSSVTATYQTAIDAVAQFFDSHFSDNVTINISVNLADLAGGLGKSFWNFNSFSYSAIRNALQSDATTSNDTTALADDVPSTDPISGTHTYFMVLAEQKALGLLAGNATGSDGSVTFDSGATTFDLDRGDGITTGRYDLAGTVAHEFTEVMGRSLLVGSTVTLSDGTKVTNSNFLLDLFHWSTDGTRSFSGTSAGYFSIDGGATDLADFNTDPTEDFGDWAGTTLVGNDSFLAFSGSGVINPVTLTDFEELDVLGWNLVETAPTVTPLTASVGEDDPSPSKDLLTGTADAESDFLSVQNLDSTVTTSGGRSLTLGTDYTLSGSTLSFTPAGFGKFNSLATGEIDTAVFGYSVSDFALSTHNTFTLSVTGTNDPPTVDPGSSILTNSVSEQPNVTNSSAIDSTSGLIAFSDPDLSDRPTATIDTAHQTVTWQNASQDFTPQLSAAQIAGFEAAFQISPEAGNTNTGKIDWFYNIVDKFVDFLGFGESVTLTSPVVIDDHHGGTVSQDIVVTINGANDSPNAAPDSNGTAKNSTLSVSATQGVLANDTDPDVHDQGHLFVSAVNGSAANVGQAVAGSFGSLTLSADGSYVYAANKGSLPAQIVAQDTFNYTAADGNGGTSTSTLSIVVFNPGVDYQSGINTTLTGGNGKEVLDGSAGGDTLLGGNSADVLIGGNGDTLTGGNGPDTYLFRPNFGTNTIADFDVKNDTIQFDKSIFALVSDIASHTTDSSAGAVITDAHGDTVTLTGMTAAQLAAHPSAFHVA
jgi:VCBS repeat-containing protein